MKDYLIKSYHAYPKVIIGVAIFLVLLLVGNIYQGINNMLAPDFLTRDDLPPLIVDEVAFIDPAWNADEKSKICLTGEGTWPSGLSGTQSLGLLEEFVEAIGYDSQQGLSDDCEVELHLTLEYAPLAASYSGQGLCSTGFDFKGKMELLSPELEPTIYAAEERQDPPDTIPAGTCGSYYQGRLENAWRRFMMAGILSIWEQDAIGAYYQVFPSVFSSPCLASADPAHLIPILDYMMKNGDHSPEPICFSKIEEMGTAASAAAPYLLYLRKSLDWEYHNTDMVYDALRAVTGEDIGNNFEDWRAWWWEQQE